VKTFRFSLFSFALIALLVLIACAPAAQPTTAPPTAAAQPTAAPPTAAPAEPTAAATEAPAAATEAPAAATATTVATEAAPAATNTPAPTPTPPPPGVTAAPGALEIEFWHALTGASQVAEFQKLADEFNAANPEYFVMPILQGNYSATLQKMNASITANSLPDLVLGNPGDLGTYHTAGVMLPLDDLMADPTDGLGELADQIDPALYFDKFGDETIGVSTGRSVQVLYYNADMLAEAGFDGPPETIAEFEEICEAVSNPPDTYCYAMVPSASTFANLVWNFGGDYASADEQTAAFNNPAGVAALEWLKKLADNEWAYTPAAAFGDQTDFGNGKVAFTIGSTAGLPFYHNAVSGSAAPFEWGIAPLPRGENGQNYVDIFGPSIGLLQSTPERQLGAWKFLKFLLSQPVEEEWAQVTTYFPANKAAADAVGAMDPASVENEAFASVLPQYKQAVTFLANGKREPSNPAWQAVRTIIANMMTAVFTGNTGADFGTADPAAAAEEGVERVNTALEEFGQ
jgi:ABC-type glycerol-3-phosphate transport system substrate-binding protein